VCGLAADTSQRKAGPGSKRIFAFCALLFLFFGVSFGQASGAEYEEYEIKAGVLYKFFNFIDWPDRSFASPKSPFVLVIVGGGENNRTIEHVLENSAVGARPLKVIFTCSADDLDKAHMIFFPKSYKNSDLPKILDRLRGKAVITVGEEKNFIAQGGVINFLQRGAKIKFQINPAPTEMSGLKISSRLLALAVGLE